MLSGMLWFDNSQTALTTRIRKAMDYYQKKYGRTPELCLVNPAMLNDQQVDDLTGIIVRPYRPVLPGHLWLGVDEMPTKEIGEQS